MSLLERIDTIEDALKSILAALEQNKEKLDRLLASRGEKEVALKGSIPEASASGQSSYPTSKLPEPEPKKETIKEELLSNFTLPKTGKYQWYVLKNDKSIKLRECSNEGCPMFLKFNEDKKKYEHWKYDVNTGVGGYVQDTCDYYEGMS